MDGLDGLSGLAAVQARIADITARARSLDPATGTAGGILGGAPAAADPSTDDTSGADFASVLGGVTAAGTGATATTVTPDAVPASGDMRSSSARLAFAHDLLTRLGLPPTPDNVRALVAWQSAEGTKAAFNPLATTRSSHQPGETQFNSVGVKNFPTYAAGLDTTVAALENGLYGPILAALQQGNSAQSVAQAVATSRWGTGQAILRALPTTTI